MKAALIGGPKTKVDPTMKAIDAGQRSRLMPTRLDDH